MKKIGSWHYGTYMDQSAHNKGAWHPPSLMVELVDRLVLRDRLLVDIWTELGSRVTYRTLLRWRKQGRSMRRYQLASWWLERRDRIATLERRGVTRREILAKVGWPPCFKRPSTPAQEVWMICHIWQTFAIMEMAENGRWAAAA